MTYALPALLLILGLALFVSAPLYGQAQQEGRAGEGVDAERERWEHERRAAICGLRELEFDREMGKLSESDYLAVRERLEARALAALKALESWQANPSPGKAEFIQRKGPISRASASADIVQETKFSSSSGLDADSSSAEQAGPSFDFFVLPPELAQPKEDSNDVPRSESERLADLPARRSSLSRSFCPNCLARVSIWARFCADCGAKLTPGVSS